MVLDIDKTKALAAGGNVVALVRAGKHDLVNLDLSAGTAALAEASKGNSEVWSSMQAKAEATILLEVFRGMSPDEIYEWIGARRGHYLSTGSFFTPEEAWSMGVLVPHVKEVQQSHGPAKVLPFRRK